MLATSGIKSIDNKLGKVSLNLLQLQTILVFNANGLIFNSPSLFLT